MSGSIKMLSIDDRTLTTDLDRAGYRSMGVFVRAAVTYEDAERILESEPIDVIVINMDYSSIDPLQVTKHLKAHEKWKSIPIVTTSVQPRARLRTLALEAGAELFVEQPLPRQYFIEKLKKLLEQKTRGTERVEVYGNVTFICQGKNYACKMGDLSATGILLSTDIDLPDNAEIDIIFDLPGYKKEIKAKGQVVRKIPYKETPDGQRQGGIGVRFTTFDGDSGKRLERYISKTTDKNNKMIYYL